jgi:hypothetical protein
VLMTASRRPLRFLPADWRYFFDLDINGHILKDTTGRA